MFINHEALMVENSIRSIFLLRTRTSYVVHSCSMWRIEETHTLCLHIWRCFVACCTSSQNHLCPKCVVEKWICLAIEIDNLHECGTCDESAEVVEPEKEGWFSRRTTPIVSHSKMHFAFLVMNFR